MTSNNVIVYEVPGADPAVDRTVTEYAGSRTTLVASDPSTIVAAAVDAVDRGADQIELCGGLGPVWHARVKEVVGDRVPVGSIMFGFESLTSAADYKARYGQEFLHSAYIYVQPGSDPAVDRKVIDSDLDRAFLVAVPEASAAAAVAAELVDDDGVQLIELYGGFEADDAAQVIEATDGRAAVGIPTYGYAGAGKR